MKKAVHVSSHTTLKGKVSVSLKALRQYVYLIFDDWKRESPYMELAGEGHGLIGAFSPVKVHTGEEDKEKLSITLEVIVNNGVPIHSQCRKLQLYMARHIREFTSVPVGEVRVRVVSCKVEELKSSID
ncbi:Asp23/Gls24 family envelope stress response protein [Alteribacter natronophilus]|uniref:Asp23/Gls24 family envelope stress response protein n=1 Tax=Alteribacter natronophilus TaxID=2583810 RepID=UPI00110DA194|nr:Asp23/Gls24 family envelope stress response protein [Alteribacter natronophilus]TMW73093.1 Asp23/Gls24 family envelope stress response protein [Alteribacter natronophilus]